MDDFGDQESFDDLRDAFVNIYSDPEYHGDGLYKAPREVAEYAHKQDDLLGLAKIELLEKLQENVYSKYDKRGKQIISAEDLLCKILDIEDADDITVMDQKGQVLSSGSYYDIDSGLLEKDLVQYTTPSMITVGVEASSTGFDKLEQLSLEQLLEKISDDSMITVEDDDTHESVTGNVSDADIGKLGRKLVTRVELTGPIEVVVGKADDLKDFNNDFDVDDYLMDDEDLFESICKANNLFSSKKDNMRSQEYWINESLQNNEDLKELYDNYVFPTADINLIEKFKEQTGYRDAIDEAQIQMYGRVIKPEVITEAVERDDPNLKQAIAKLEKDPAAEAIIVSYTDGEGKKHPSMLTAGNQHELDKISKYITNRYNARYISTLFRDQLNKYKKMLGSSKNESVRSFKDRQSLSEAVNKLKNNNRPYSIRRSVNEGYRYDLILEAEDSSGINCAMDKLETLIGDYFNVYDKKIDGNKGSITFLLDTWEADSTRVDKIIGAYSDSDYIRIESSDDRVYDEVMNYFGDELDSFAENIEEIEQECGVNIYTDDVYADGEVEINTDAYETDYDGEFKILWTIEVRGGNPIREGLEDEEMPEEEVIDVVDDEVIEEEPEINCVEESAIEVMAAYQNANKWLDSVKEVIYTKLNCPFFSSLVHTLAHTMPARFDKFGDILHTINMEIPYPQTAEIAQKPNSIINAFDIIFNVLDSIKSALNKFIKCTDDEYHGMSCAAEACLNDIESEYPMLYRLQAKAQECGDDTVSFDKFVGQYVEHKGSLLEGLNEAKKDDELPPDPKAVKRNVQATLNSIAQNKLDSVQEYQDMKAEIADSRVENKDKIINTIDEIIEGDEADIDKLNNAAASIPFGKNNNQPESKEEVEVVDDEPIEIPDTPDLLAIDDEEPEVKESLLTKLKAALGKKEVKESLLDKLKARRGIKEPAKENLGCIAQENLNEFLMPDEWEEVATKSVRDVDGFITDYTWYTNGEYHRFIFGDNELYKPDEADADWEIEIEPGYEWEAQKEAQQWFNNYGEDAEDDLDFDEKQFDKEMSESLTEAYQQPIIYTTNNGSIDKKGVIILEGVLTDGTNDVEVKFNLTPTNKIFESLSKAQIIGSTYKVTNNLSEEVFEFKF